MTQYWISCFSEFVGSIVLILLGNGINSSVFYKRMNANESNKWFIIAFGWGLAVFVAVIVSVAMGGNGHLNPAVSIMDAINASDLDVSNQANSNSLYIMGMNVYNISLKSAIALTFFIIILFQLTGAMIGQILIDLLNIKFLANSENSLETIKKTHCTSSIFNNKKDKATWCNFLYELVGTLVLVGVALGLEHLKQTDKISDFTSVFAIFLTIVVIGLALGSVTGYAINPARDLGPRIIFFSFIKIFRKQEFNKKIFDLQYAWIPIFAPFLAGIIIGCFSLIK